MAGVGPSFFASMLNSCTGSLRDLTINDISKLSEYEAAIRVTKSHLNLERLKMKGYGARRCFAAMSESVASSLLVLSLKDDADIDEFYSPIEGNFEKLEKLEMEGSGSESCASSLLELKLDAEYEPFPEALRGNFAKLEKLTIFGVGVARYFASMSASCSHSLLELDLHESFANVDEEYEGFPKGLGGNLNLMKLEKLCLTGHGAIEWFASVSESLAPSLVEVRIYGWETNFVAIPGEFAKLKYLFLGGTENAMRIFEQMNVDHDSVVFETVV
eukprot:GHVU01111323.1.p1 GENE.GHVU01111323.1~~GHVU01111323.1.p1  ORF type:complete len:273 (+),score=39.66 GHVU01111323.1:39-857(+)